MTKLRLPYNMQFFAAAGDAGTGDTGAGQGTDQQAQNQQTEGGAQGTPQIDYAKIQQMLEGTLKSKEDTALKAYFKQQGLSQEEAEQAMTAFKAEKAKNQPDVTAMQTQLAQAQAAAQQAAVDKAATLAAIGLGIDAKTIPYVLKMADMSQVVGQDGKINEETLKNALNKVLEDVPALKPQAGGITGFTQVGTGGNPSQQPQQTTTQSQTPAKRWNRWN